MVWHALQAAEQLHLQHISARVINIHTIKPLDREIIIQAAKDTGAIVTAEEHQIAGGFGSAIAEVLAEECPVPVEFVGVNDSFGESGHPNELMQKYGLSAENIVAKSLKVLARK
jgi:transketolase